MYITNLCAIYLIEHTAYQFMLTLGHHSEISGQNPGYLWGWLKFNFSWSLIKTYSSVLCGQRIQHMPSCEYTMRKNNNVISCMAPTHFVSVQNPFLAANTFLTPMEYKEDSTMTNAILFSLHNHVISHVFGSGLNSVASHSVKWIDAHSAWPQLELHSMHIKSEKALANLKLHIKTHSCVSCGPRSQWATPVSNIDGKNNNVIFVHT